MPYFPPRTEPTPYQCEGCKGWFIVPEIAVSCCVLHPPGTCCHYGETPVGATPAAEQCVTITTATSGGDTLWIKANTVTGPPVFYTPRVRFS